MGATRAPSLAIAASCCASTSWPPGGFPSLYAFADGTSGTFINDGGQDMYDGGNQITTSLCSSQLAPYTADMTVVASDCFGTGTKWGLSRKKMLRSSGSRL